MVRINKPKVETHVNAEAKFTVVLDGKDVQFTGEIDIKISNDSFSIDPAPSPLIEFLGSVADLFSPLFGNSTELKNRTKAESEDELTRTSGLHFRGRRFTDVTLRVPVYTAPIFQTLLGRTHSATKTIVPASSYKCDIDVEFPNGDQVKLMGCFVNQAPFLHPIATANGLVVPLSVDYVADPNSALSKYAISQPKFDDNGEDEPNVARP